MHRKKYRLSGRGQRVSDPPDVTATQPLGVPAPCCIREPQCSGMSCLAAGTPCGRASLPSSVRQPLPPPTGNWRATEAIHTARDGAMVVRTEHPHTRDAAIRKRLHSWPFLIISPSVSPTHSHVPTSASSSTSVGPACRQIQSRRVSRSVLRYTVPAGCGST